MKQVVIEISDDAYEAITSSGYVVSDFNMISAIRNGTVLPDNPTNGDMIKTVFPDIALYEKNHDAIEISFNGVWWNTPYERSTDADSN